MKKSNTGEFINGIMFHKNATLYKKSYNPENFSNIAYTFVLDEFENLNVTKSIHEFTEPFFNTNGVNKNAEFKKAIAENKLEGKAFYDALAAVIASDFTKDLIVIDQSVTGIYTHDKFKRIITVLIDMLSFSSDDLDAFLSLDLDLTNKDLIDLISKLKLSAIKRNEIDALFTANKQAMIEQKVEEIKLCLENYKKSQKQRNK